MGQGAYLHSYAVVAANYPVDSEGGGGQMPSADCQEYFPDWRAGLQFHANFTVCLKKWLGSLKQLQEIRR